MHKLIANLIEAHHPHNKVIIELDGVQTEISKGVRRVIIDSGDAQCSDSPIGEVTIWAGVLHAEVTISDHTAEALLRLLAERTLTFIKPTEAQNFVDWCKKHKLDDLVASNTYESKVISPQIAKVLCDLAAELGRRGEISF